MFANPDWSSRHALAVLAASSCSRSAERSIVPPCGADATPKPSPRIGSPRLDERRSSGAKRTTVLAVVGTGDGSGWRYRKRQLAARCASLVADAVTCGASFLAARRLCVGGVRTPVQRRRSHGLRRTPPLYRDLQVEQERRNTQERPTPRDGRVRDLPWKAEHRRSEVLATTPRRRRRSRVQRGAVIDRLRPSTYHACRARQSGGPAPAPYTIFTSRLA